MYLTKQNQSGPSEAFAGSASGGVSNSGEIAKPGPEGHPREVFQAPGSLPSSWMVGEDGGSAPTRPSTSGYPTTEGLSTRWSCMEVAHLAGVGDYGSDAWRLFCKKSFYAGHQIVVADEWRTLEPKDKDLRRYVEQKRREEQVRLLTDDVISRMAAVQLSSASASCSKPAPQPGLLFSIRRGGYLWPLPTTRVQHGQVEWLQPLPKRKTTSTRHIPYLESSSTF